MVYQWEIASKWLLSPQVETLEKLTGKDGQKKDGKNGHAARTLELWFFCEFRYVHFSIHVLHELTNFFRKLFHDDESDVEEVKKKLLVCWLSGFKFFFWHVQLETRDVVVMILSYEIFHAWVDPQMSQVSRGFTRFPGWWAELLRMLLQVCFHRPSKISIENGPQVAGYASSSCWWLLALWLLPGYWNFPVLRLVSLWRWRYSMWSQYFHFAEVVQGCFQRQALKGNSWWDVHRHREKFS